VPSGRRAHVIGFAALALPVATLTATALLVLQSPEAAPVADSVAGTVDVRHVYLRDCAFCHGAGGGGTDLGPSLRGVGRAAVDYELTTGRMPLPEADADVVRRAPKYDAATIRQLDDYVVSIAGGDGPDIPRVTATGGDLALGGTLFRLECAACHAWSGEGGALLHREAPSTHRATPTQIAEAVRVGPGNMPAFGAAALSARDVRALVHYVRYLDHPDDRGGAPLWHLGPMVEGAVAIVIGLGVLVLAARAIGTRT
jgi:ubiquinol-cytochrome c reductase cytochrome c subunit